MRHWNAVLCSMVLLALAAPGHGQARRELTLDVRPFSADVSIAWPVTTGHLLGLTAGGGPDELNHTFTPEPTVTTDEFITLEQIVRVGSFYRYESGRGYSLDVGLRAALGGVRGGSGSMNAVGGLHVAPFYGGRWLRVGPRLFIGRSTEHDVDTIVHVEWITARLRLAF